MIKIIQLFLLLFIWWPVFSQETCQYDADGNCIAKGKLKAITHKTSYGGKYNIHARVGQWILFNTDGIKKAEGTYKYENEYSNKDGEWTYYSEESMILYKRWYVRGMIEKTQFYDSGYYAHESDTVLIISDSMGNLKIEERKGNVNYRYTATPMQFLDGDPGKFAKIEKSKAKEMENIHHTDEEIIQQYPIIRATLNVKRWAVNTSLNLINNPDFEAMRDKMEKGHNTQIKPGGEYYAKYWSSANETPDIYFNNDNCYAGYRVFGVNYEVLRNELKEPLKAGVSYCMQFKLKLKMENSNAINGVSVTISKNLMGFRIPNDGIKNGIVLQTHKDLPLACRDQWMTISGSFTATGGERYLYIGNFTTDAELKITSVDNGRNRYVDEIYYYIDDVVLIAQKKETICPCNIDGCDLKHELNDTLIKGDKDNIYTSPKVGQKIVLRNIRFETNKSELLQGSFETIDSLLVLMRQFPNMKVEISGHTDNRGNLKNNEVLSVNRAFAVATYLMDAGIEEERITYKGTGQKEPVDSNDTESGRFNNRRVEFKILSL